MFRIFIVDDEDVARHIASKIDSFKEEDACMEISYTSTKEKSWEVLAQNPFRYNVVIINIGSTAEEIKMYVRRARKLYELNPEIGLVFVTTASYVPLDVYRTPHLYVVKRPFVEEELCVAVEILRLRIKMRLAATEKLIVAEQSKRVLFVRQPQIVYAYKTRGGLQLVTDAYSKSEPVIYKNTIDEFQKEAGESFCRCHSSYTVNVSHAASLLGESISMDNGDIIPVSRAYKRQVKEYISRLNG